MAKVKSLKSKKNTKPIRHNILLKTFYIIVFKNKKYSVIFCTGC